MKAFLNWSGGKDSALCLSIAKEQGIAVDALVTSVNTVRDRITMHGVRRSLLQQQAASVQLPLYSIELPAEPGMEAYEKAVSLSNAEMKNSGYGTAVFGDIFLEDLRLYREKLYAKDGISCRFPLWKMKSSMVMKRFFDLQFKAIVVCVNGELLDPSFCGRLLDESFIRDLPPDVDPCGENGEYHSFVFDGPYFNKPVDVRIGEITKEEYRSPSTGDCFTKPKDPVPFYYCDLLPA